MSKAVGGFVQSALRLYFQNKIADSLNGYGYTFPERKHEWLVPRGIMHAKIVSQLLPPTLAALDELAKRLQISLADLMTEVVLMDGTDTLEKKAQRLLVDYYRALEAGLSDDPAEWQHGEGPSHLKSALETVRKMNRKT
jgi:hypothetical protein